MKTCLIDACEKPVVSKGLCSAHYHRQRRNGDPKGGRTPDGTALKYYKDVVLNHEGGDCLIWPFTRTTHGYGQICLGAARVGVHRLVCNDRHGPPPTSEHVAAHSCGNGHLGCVSPDHLSWKTVKENSADAVLHGTLRRGEACWNAKLTASTVRKIRKLKGVISQRQIAEKLGVSPATVSHIHAGRQWVSVT